MQSNFVMCMHDASTAKNTKIPSRGFANDSPQDMCALDSLSTRMALQISDSSTQDVGYLKGVDGILDCLHHTDPAVSSGCQFYVHMPCLVRIYTSVRMQCVDVNSMYICRVSYVYIRMYVCNVWM
jgi:hypothetical protein